MRLLPSYVRPRRWGRYIGELTIRDSALPRTYIEKFNYWETRKSYNHPRFRRAIYGRGNLSFSDDRAWTNTFMMRNQAFVDETYIVKPMRDWFWFKGDVVEILVGKDKGKQGNILQVFQERNWVTVRGLNMYFQKPNRYIKASKMGMDAHEEQYMEAPLLVGTQVALIDPADMQPTEVEWRYTEEGENVRVSLRTGRIIPKPSAAEETYAYKTRESYKEDDLKDTKKEDVIASTYVPRLLTFDMEIMQEMGIEEERVPKKTYWC